MKNYINASQWHETPGVTPIYESGTRKVLVSGVPRPENYHTYPNQIHSPKYGVMKLVYLESFDSFFAPRWAYIKDEEE